MDVILVLKSVLIPAKQAPEPSTKLIIVAPYTHGNNGGPGIAMLHLVAKPQHSDGPTGCQDPVKMAQNGCHLSAEIGADTCQASPRTLYKAHHCCPIYPWQQWRAWDSNASPGCQATALRWPHRVPGSCENGPKWMSS